MDKITDTAFIDADGNLQLTNRANFAATIADLKFNFSQLIIWNKSQSVMGRKDFQPMHELIFYGWYGRHKYYGGKDKSVLNFPKPKSNTIHPTMKPPALLRKLIYHGTQPGMVVYDAFGGSGSTLVACEQWGRKCRMIEISEEYCKSITIRYIKLRKEMNREAEIKINGVVVSQIHNKVE